MKLRPFWIILALGIVQVQACDDYAGHMSKLNQAYRHKIDIKERSSVAEVPYRELETLNQQRFRYASGIQGKIRDTGPTEEEWYQITDMLWQHAACLLENHTLYNDNDGFKPDGFKTAIQSLLKGVVGIQQESSLTETLQKLDRKAKANVLALTRGLFYALHLYTSHLPFDGWGWAGLQEFQEQATLTPIFKENMDAYFERVYDHLRNEGSTQEHKKEISDFGHLVFFISGDKNVEANVTAVTRRYVTTLERGSEGKEYQNQSPFYIARVTRQETLKQRFPQRQRFFQSPPRDYETVLKPLILSQKNVDKYPYQNPVWLKKSHFKDSHNVFDLFNFEKLTNSWLTAFHFTLKEPENFFKESIPGVYAHLILDWLLVDPKLTPSFCSHTLILGFIVKNIP